MKLAPSLIAMAIALAPIAASAASLDAEQLMKSFNIIALDDMDLRATDHVEGTVYVGDDYNTGATGTSPRTPTSINTDNMAPGTVGDVTGALIVGGEAGGNFGGAMRGDIVIGSSYSGRREGSGGLQSGVGTNTPAGIPVDEMVSTFTALSGNLASLESTSGTGFNTAMNFKSFTSGAGDEDGIAVLNISRSQAMQMLNEQQQITFDLSGGASTFIINVAGTDLGNLGAMMNTDTPSVLFNFYEADYLNFTSTWRSAILATGALVDTAPGGSNGVIVASDVVLGGEVRPYNDSYTYGGTLPTTIVSPPPPVTSVPVPAALPMAAGGLGLLAFLARRRKRA
ncbi:collagen-binding domain-containing protein [Mangrovicoccus ximenensis]|uniref:collagen-binding domain-containing protein n=1 Tax=Mangrovicoccus ximenensis TaxID=1911570 RepID=UPI001374E663|nr:collagen-binding domain-containing protein [Mangrovicoccus ximenensis]